MTKAQLRRDMMSQRQALQLKEKEILDREITRRAIGCLEGISPSSIHIFRTLSSLGEIDTSELITWAASQGLIIFSTVKLADAWHIVQLRADGTDTPHDPPSLDAIIVPLLAFDHRLHRLGYGGGYYDRLAADRPEAQLIGLAYEFQRVETLPIEAHDVQLDLIITEQQAYRPIDKA